MSGPNIATIKVLIKPQFASDNHVKSISIYLPIDSPRVHAGDALLSFPIIVNEPALRCCIESLKAVDREGPLPVYLEDGGERWIVKDRSNLGDVKLLYEAVPFPRNATKSPLDLRCDQGGILGPGFSFMPVLQTTEI